MKIMGTSPKILVSIPPEPKNQAKARAIILFNLDSNFIDTVIWYDEGGKWTKMQVLKTYKCLNFKLFLK